MHLQNYSTGQFTTGASFIKRVFWHFFGSQLVASRLLPFSSLKAQVLKVFGCKIGKAPVIKPGVRIKYPWKLSIGDYSWIGEDVWIDNVAAVKIGSNTCISQGVYICGGDHDFKKKTFDLRIRPITIGDSVWIAAQCNISPGTVIEDGAVLTLGSTAKGTLKKNYIYSGLPAAAVKKREFIPESSTAEKSKIKEILFINQAYYPDNSASAQYLLDLSTSLASKGHSVTVLCSRLNYLDKYTVYKTNENYQNVNIIRTGALQFAGKSKIVRVLNGLIMNLSFLLKIATLPRFDSIIVMTSPPLVAWTARYFAKKPRHNFIYWIMDLNPDQAIAAGWIKENSLITVLLNKALRSVLDYSDKVIVLDALMKKRIECRINDPGKIEILPLWINRELLAPTADTENQFRKQHGLENKFVVMYSGNLSLCHPVTTLLNTALKLKSDPSVAFIVVGGGPALTEVKEFKQRYNLDNLEHLPYEERSNLSTSLSAADLHLVSLGDKFSGIVHPSKIYGILGVEKPFVLIGPEESFINKEFVSLDLGKRVGHGDCEGLEAAIKDYQGNTGAMPSNYKSNLDKIINTFEQGNICARLEKML